MSSSTHPARTVVELMAALQRSDAARPRLTWYGPGGERIELSARTLANWVNKTANLLVDELDLMPGEQVTIAMGPHWKSIVIDLAVRCAGGDPVWADGDDAEFVVTDQPARFGCDRILAVEPASLARGFSGELPPGAVDYAAEATGQDDVFLPTHAAVLGPADRLPDIGSRILVRTDESDVADRILDVLRADGSAVLAVPETSRTALGQEAIS